MPREIKAEIIFGRYAIIAEAEAKDLGGLSHPVTYKTKCIPNILSTEPLIRNQP